MFLAVEMNGKGYKVFADDVKKIYKTNRRHRPQLPKYVRDVDEEKEKDENETQICFGSL